MVTPFLCLPLCSKTVPVPNGFEEGCHNGKEGGRKNPCSASMFQNECLNSRQKQKPNEKGYHSFQSRAQETQHRKVISKKGGKKDSGLVRASFTTIHIILKSLSGPMVISGTNLIWSWSLGSSPGQQSRSHMPQLNILHSARGLTSVA